MKKFSLKPCFIAFIASLMIPTTGFSILNNRNSKNKQISSTVTFGQQANYLAMNNTKDSPTGSNLKPLSVLSKNDIPSLLSNSRSSGDDSYIVGSTAEFPGGEEALKEYFNENVMYPREEKCIRATVVVKFLVNEQGEIEETTLVQSVSPNFDRSALRAIWNFPKWTPASDVNGNPIKSYVVLPFVFDAR